MTCRTRFQDLICSHKEVAHRQDLPPILNLALSLMAESLKLRNRSMNLVSSLNTQITRPWSKNKARTTSSLF